MPITSEFSECDVIELRRYLLKPGAFDDLLRVFQQSLIEGLEESGMRLGGLFRDLDNLDRFVWFRGFASMEQRRAALDDFYYGPVWRQHRAEANETMVDSDDVLLLRPTEPSHRPAAATTTRPSQAGPTASQVRAVAEIIYYAAEPELEHWLSTVVHARLEQVLGTSVAAWRTEPAQNTFPALPVRDVHAFVWLAVFDDDAACRSAAERLAADATWAADIEPRIEACASAVERMWLQPTTHSLHPSSAARA